MSSSQTVLLGALAGFTISWVSRSPVFAARAHGRRCCARRARARDPALSARHVLAHAVEPVEQALHDASDGRGLARVTGRGDSSAESRGPDAPRSTTTLDRLAHPPSKLTGPGAAAIAEGRRVAVADHALPGVASGAPDPTGLGLDNFGEDLDRRVSAWPASSCWR